MFSRCKPTQHYYETCQHCGANLDPGEQCDCKKEKEIRKDATLNVKPAATR